MNPTGQLTGEVDLVRLVSPIQPHKEDKPHRPEQPAHSHAAHFIVESVGYPLHDRSSQKRWINSAIRHKVLQSPYTSRFLASSLPLNHR
jgi:hypothetical protein